MAENLYVTDNYSIENDVVNGHVFCRVIEEILGIQDLNEDERERICERFHANLEYFLRSDGTGDGPNPYLEAQRC